MAKGKGAPSAVKGKTAAQSMVEQRAAAGKLMEEMWNARNEEIALDDTPQPKYIETGPVNEAERLRNKKLRDAAESSRMVKFLLKSEELSKAKLEADAQRLSQPLHRGDRPLWKALPRVPGPFGIGTLVRQGLAGQQEKGVEVFLDFFRNFHFGLWGFQPRAYPPQKPFDIQQAIGTKRLEKRYYDFAMRGGQWWYKDRLGRTRGPCEIIQLKTAWAGGVIDRNTFVWGDDMDEFAPIGMVYGLKAAVATPDVQLAALGTGLMYRLGMGRNPFKALKGLRKKSLKQLQAEALEEKEKEMRIMRNAGGFWPGLQAPAHALFLWAGGGQLTKLLEQGKPPFPDKYIPYDIRKRLAKAIPGLRPWEVLEVEQVYDYLTFRDDFWRYPLGAYTTTLNYREDYLEREAEEWGEIKDAMEQAYPGLEG